jgi:myo-inositol-1(or 4)-monophosphatase
MEVSLNRNLVSEIESQAIDMAQEAGNMLKDRFGKDIEVEYKDKKEQDPVTSADKDIQTYLTESIARLYPDHGILGEEGPHEGDDIPSPEFLWVLDPLDGTKNFLNGLPIYAVSIGVIHRGIPVAGALFIPWPNDSGGVVIHARKGGGTWIDDRAILVSQSEGPTNSRLSGIPGSFGGMFQVGKDLSGRMGDPRITGSIAYDLAMAACGVLQYVVLGAPKIWDIAGGVVLVTEAGGMVHHRPKGRQRWEKLTSLGPSWDDGPPRMKDVRNWVSPMIAGSPQIASLVADNLHQAKRPLSQRIARMVKRGKG